MGDEHDVPAPDSAVRNGGEDLLPRYGLDGVGLLRSIRFAMERRRSRTLVDEANEKLERPVVILCDVDNLLAVVERLGCHVIAKGVETSEQACVLAKAGVRLAQG